MSEPVPNPSVDAPEPAAPGSNASRVMGGILLVIGILVMGLSGLCTGACLIIALPEMARGSAENFFTMLGAGAVIGGIPFAFGFLFFWLGRRMRKAADQA